MCRLMLTGIEKTYKDKKAVKDLTIHFDNGVYGLLGENGARKDYINAYDCRYSEANAGTDLL